MKANVAEVVQVSPRHSPRADISNDTDFVPPVLKTLRKGKSISQRKIEILTLGSGESKSSS